VNFLPTQVAELTFDQLYILCANPKELMPMNRQRISFEEAMARGLIKNQVEQ